VPTAFAALWAKVTPLVQLAVDLWQPSQLVTAAWVALFGFRAPGEKLPVWQVAHWVLNVSLLCSRAPVQTVVPLWQVSQLVIATPVSAAYGMCVTGRPSAGGNVPVWQVEHCAATFTWVWFHFDGSQVAVPWQAKQFVAPTGMWFPALPMAALPLWQLAQLVAAVKMLWSTFAPAQVVVDLWQVSQAAVVGVCPADLPTAGAKPPVWQLAHWATTATLLCTFAGAQARKPALWQVSQLLLLMPATPWYGTCVACLPSAGGKVPLWQLEHWAATASWV
jgi:hypothetical protein